MKIHLFLYLFLWSGGSLTAQELYTPGKVTKGKNASYYCTTTKPDRLIAVRNVQNIDTTLIVYDKNGKVVEDGFYCIIPYQFSKDDLIAVLKEVLTKEEWEKICERKKFFLDMHMVLDDAGKAKEITFRFFKTDPLFSQLAPDRLYLIEQRFKQIIEFQLTSDQKTHKNPKCAFVIYFQDLF